MFAAIEFMGVGKMLRYVNRRNSVEDKAVCFDTEMGWTCNLKECQLILYHKF